MLKKKAKYKPRQKT